MIMAFPSIAGQVSSFVTVFLGIFIEAAPFLLIGTIASGLVESFVSRDEVTRLIPHNPVAATVIGGLRMWGCAPVTTAPQEGAAAFSRYHASAGCSYP
jgi:uncharacterized membrane protein YraQ (UPF0718 family)